MPFAFLPTAAELPLIADDKAVALGFEHWRERLEQVEDAALREAAAAIAEDEAGRHLLSVIFANSPFLTHCLLRDLGFFVELLREGPEAAVARVVADCRERVAALEAREAVAAGLRIARRRLALAVALADIAGRWPVEKVTGTLSDFADAALDAALGHLLRGAAARGELRLADPETPLADCGYVVLAMGKYGAWELNYSSDIDLIVLYDPERIDYAGARGVHDGMVRLTRELMRLIDERTGEGYVFRTDLRLRPDPGATPLALSIGAALVYYESAGQNWERAAMIKARPAAGDKALGQWFLDELRPFVWRKHLDFWAIQDIHSIKRQIHAHKGGAAIAVEGHNVKLGRGGIREIEFFAQTQQLIFGGKDPRLRAARTLDALGLLAETGRVAPEAAEEMGAAYRFLRSLEHRLQMVEDQQTHSLPADAEGLRRIAAFMGFDAVEGLRRTLLGHLRRVESHYAELFEEAPSLSGPGNLVFTGGEPEPGTLETLAKLGFKDGERTFQLVRAWHHGRYRATRSTRARELLTELMPALLGELGKTRDPDAALGRFDAFLGRLPAGVQLFALLYQNPGLLEMLAEIMGRAPALAEHLGRRPGLLEAVLEPGFFEPLPGLDGLEAELAEQTRLARDFQDVLDEVRRWANDRKFQVGVQMLRRTVDVADAGRALSGVAEACIRALIEPVHEELARLHGRLAGPGLAVIALGKLGAHEMTVESDLDLVFVYESAPGAEESDGAKPIAPSQYFGRFAQRLITALSSLTGEGRLYDVDPRLRPSGSAGPIALSLAGYGRYYREDAWTWELMALTRARVIAGEPGLAERLRAVFREVLTRPRDPDRLLADVAAMRARIRREFPGRSIWDAKYHPGGLYDLDFIAQYLQLRHAAEHPEVLDGATEASFARLAEHGLLERAEAERLIAATRLWRQVQSFLRLTVGDGFDEAAAPEGLRAALARACDAESFEALREQLAATAATVQDSYRRLIEEPAAALAPPAARA